MYTNEKIEQLIKQRDDLNNEIEKEIEKEKQKYKFSYKRFILTIFIGLGVIAAFHINKKIFPENSIWSWSYYIK